MYVVSYTVYPGERYTVKEAGRGLGAKPVTEGVGELPIVSGDWAGSGSA